MSDTTADNERIFYSIEAPGVIRSNANYVVAVSIFEAPEACDIKLSLYGGDFKVEKSVEVQPLSTEILCFEVPALNSQEEYYLVAEGQKCIDFKEKINLRFKEGKPLAYIQCDKQAYKRGDNVDYRVCVLDRDFLRPTTLEQPISIKMKRLDDIVVEHSAIDIEKGLYTTQWSIPEDAAPGNYDIEVLMGDSLLALKSFEVINHSPPKFEVKISAPKEILYIDKQINIGVEASYADGSPVKGICKMEIESVAGFFSGVYIEKSMPIIGKTEPTIIDVVEDLDIDNTFMEYDWFRTASIMLKVTVTADETKDEEIFTTLVTVKQNESVVDEFCRGCRKSSGWCTMDTEESRDEECEPIRITRPEKNVSFGETVEFTITLGKPAQHCMYFVVARGNIVKTEVIKVDDYQKPIVCRLETTFQFVPRAFILAYFIHDGILYFDEVGFNTGKEFENKLEISLPNSADPGTSITIQVKSAPNSFISLMGVDEKSVVLNAKNDLRPEQFLDDLYHVRSQTPKVKGSGRYPGLAPGLLTFTNAKIDGFEPGNDDDDGFCRLFDREHFKIESCMPRIDTEAKKKDIIRMLQERNQVFGNWLFINKDTDENGDLSLDVTLPHNPTTWLLTAFAVSAEKGFTMTDEPIKIHTQSVSNTREESINGTEDSIAISKATEFVVDHYDDEESKYTLECNYDLEPMEIIFSITENLYGSTIADLAEYAGIMYCTGHLHMTTVIPNINVLEYLDSLEKVESEFAISIKKRFPEAIERELSERRELDGSFSWFGRDPTGSPHVTSLVLQAFQRVAKYVDVDPLIIERGLKYLASTQLESGEITPEADPYKYPFEKDVGVGLTSMVLLAFLHSEEVRAKYSELISKAFDYIVDHIEPINCVYDLALAFYAMQLAKHPYAEILKNRLLEVAKKDELKNHMWWPYSLLSNTEPDSYPPISELEVTSYVLLGLLETETIEVMLPIVKWMLPLRNMGNETMDCAVALNAVLKMAVKSGAALATINVTYSAYGSEGEYNGKITLTPENSSKIQMHVLPITTEKVEFSTTDKGTFFGKLNYRHKKEN